MIRMPYKDGEVVLHILLDWIGDKYDKEEEPSRSLTRVFVRSYFGVKSAHVKFEDYVWKFCMCIEYASNFTYTKSGSQSTPPQD